MTRALVSMVLVFGAAAAAAQTPASKVPPPQPGMAYDRYEASQRLRLRAEACMRDEDEIGVNCVKKCSTGYYTLDNPPRGPRICRSERPLGMSPIQPPVRKQEGVQPVPPAPAAKPVPGA